MSTDTEKNIAIGAAIGIVSAMASARIAAANGSFDNNDERLSRDARIIASAMLGTNIPETDEAVLGLVKSLDEDQLLSEMTFADVVSGIEDSNRLHAQTIEEAVAKAEESVSPDIVSLNHIDEHARKLMGIADGWTEMDYEHERMIASLPRPKYSDAIAQAHANGIKAGYYDPAGGISDAHVEKLRKQMLEEKEQAKREAEEAALRAEMGEDNENASGEAADAPNEDTFFADLAEKISSPIGDEVGEHDTGEFESVGNAHAAHAKPRVSEAAEPASVNSFDSDKAEGDSGSDSGEPDDEFGKQPTQEFPAVEIPSDEVLEILEPEPVKDPTDPIVLDPNEVVDAIVEEAADTVDDEAVAEVVETMAEEMIEAAELDPEECKSFTDQFMAVEIGEDGHARPKQPIEEGTEPEKKEDDFASLYGVEGGNQGIRDDADSQGNA